MTRDGRRRGGGARATVLLVGVAVFCAAGTASSTPTSSSTSVSPPVSTAAAAAARPATPECLWALVNVTAAPPTIVAVRDIEVPPGVHRHTAQQHCMNSEGYLAAGDAGDAPVEVWCDTGDDSRLMSAHKRARELVGFRFPWVRGVNAVAATGAGAAAGAGTRGPPRTACRRLGFRFAATATPAAVRQLGGRRRYEALAARQRATAATGIFWRDVAEVVAEGLAVQGEPLPPPRTASAGRVRRRRTRMQNITPQDVDLQVIQEVGPVQTQVTVTFVAAGYVADDAAKFADDVERAWMTMRGDSLNLAVLDSAPWPRYYPLLNVYSIFQESPESGASMPHGPGHTAPRERYCSDAKGCEPFEVDDNLGCAYGTPHQKMLNCDWARVLELASFAPAADLVVVLVNHGVYGGTGDPGPPNVAPEERVGVAMLYNGESLPLLLVHEVGHAFAGLSDEYSYGVAETEDLGLINCSPNKDAFAPWVARGEADPLAVTPCSYTNYYRPTANRCLMGAVYPKMCGVCKAGMVAAMYAKPLDITQPRCPLADEIVQLAPEDEITLRVGAAFALQDEVVVRWTMPVGFLHTFTDDELAAASILVKGSYLVPGEHVFQATVEDRTGMVLSRGDRMTAVAEFQVTRVVDSFARQASLCTNKACSGAGFTDPEYCSTCVPGGVCNVTRVITPKERVVDVTGAIGMARDTAILMGFGILCALVLIGGVFTYSVMQYRATHVMEVVILTPAMATVRVVLLAVGVVAVLGSVVVFCMSTYFFEQMELFGQSIIVIGMVVSAVMFVVCAVLAVAALLRHVGLLFATTVMMTLTGIAAFMAGAFALWLADNLNTHDVRSSLQDQWDAKVASHPAAVCTFQQQFDCSGFTKSCANLGGTRLPSFCPADCELANRNADACFVRLERFVEGNFRPFGGAMVAAGVGFWLVGVGCLLLATAVMNRREEMQRRRRRRLTGIEGLELNSSSDESDDDVADPDRKHQPLTEEEIKALEVEFRKVDRDGSGFLNHEETFQFWSESLGEKPSDIDIANATKLLDQDGNGKISFDEFLALYQPFDHRSSLRQPHRSGAAAVLHDPQIQGEVTPGEVRYLKRQFQRLDRGTGTIASRPQLRTWFATLYRRQPLDDELDVFFKAMDPAREGKITFDGFAIPYRELRRKKAKMLMNILGIDDLRALRVLFAVVNRGHDSLLQTQEEFTEFYREFHETDGTEAQVAEFTRQVVANSEGVVGFLDFCVPFARRVQRRTKMRAGLDDERIQLIRERYQQLEKTPDGALTVNAVRELYTVLYDNEPTAEGLRLFVQELDLERDGAVSFDELLRLFAETSRLAAAKLWLLGRGVTEAEAELSQTDFLALSTTDAGLRIGVSKDAFAALVRNVARHLRVAAPTTTSLNSMFTQYDEDGDEYLDEMEFTKAHFHCVICAMHASGQSSAQLQLVQPPLPSHPSQQQPASDVLSPDASQRNPLLGDV